MSGMCSLHGLGRESEGSEELGNFQRFTEQFQRYMLRARALERSSVTLEKQLESLQQIEELSTLEGVFTEQIGQQQQSLWQLLRDLNVLEKELKEMQQVLERFHTKTEYENNQQLQDTFENLNKNANEALLKNLELQIRTQFLQEDINSTKERNRKNLTEIQDYLNVVRDVRQSISCEPTTTLSWEGEEKELVVDRGSEKVSGLDNGESDPSPLTSQKGNETTTVEQPTANMHGGELDQMQSHREQIEVLKKKLGEVERNLEQCVNECRCVVMYQQSLDDELESYKRFIANEDSRSQPTPTKATAMSASSRYDNTEVSPVGKDITVAALYSVPLQASEIMHSRKASKKKDITSSGDKCSNGAEQECAKKPSEVSEDCKISAKEDEEEDEDVEFYSDEGEEATKPDDVPDGAQISRLYNALCNIVRDRMGRHKKSEPPVATFYTKGHYVLVTGEASYMDPFFCTTVPTRSQVIVTFEDQPFPADIDTLPQPDLPTPLKYNGDGDGKKDFDSTKENGKDREGEKKDEKADDGKSGGNGELKRPIISASILPPTPSLPDPSQASDFKPTPFSGPSTPQSDATSPDNLASRGGPPGQQQKEDKDRATIITPTQPLSPDQRTPEEPKYRYYEKIEMTEAVETFRDNKLEGYSETSTIVETTVEKTSQEQKAKRS
ncbi:filensin isoform X1 [Chiloscyllium plagiosum]|uniref:filensin isoform X1 n=1 Tax=Chiloscyllium plagiosum TaxID=36176 RepID=UPI001CB7F092|nr:filensin isoform X1 [Chiloscyllium plagiosum]